MDFQVTDRVQMKSNIKGINTFGIKKSIIKKHKNTIMIARDYFVCDNGDRILRCYGIGEENELRMAIWNADMFEKVERR